MPKSVALRIGEISQPSRGALPQVGQNASRFCAGDRDGDPQSDDDARARGGRHAPRNNENTWTMRSGVNAIVR
jgi:hypothetical protein